MENKNKKKTTITLLLLLLSPYPTESFLITGILTAVSFAYQAYQIVNDAHDTYKKFAPATTLDDVLNQAKKVESKIDKLGAKLSEQISKAVNSIVTQIDDRNNMREGFSKIANGIRRIDNLYLIFELYTAKKLKLNNDTLQEYIKQVTTMGPLGPRDILSEIFDVIVPGRAAYGESLLHYIKKDASRNDAISYQELTPALEKIYQIFEMIMINEVRAFTMMCFAYTLNQAFKCESYAGEIQFAAYQMKERTRDYHEVFSEVLGGVSSAIQTFSPPQNWTPDTGFYELIRYKSFYYVNDKALRQDGICKSTKEEPSPQFYPANCNEDVGCRNETQCYGKLLHCRKDKRKAVRVCQLEPWELRYLFVTNNSPGKHRSPYFNDAECTGQDITIMSQKNCILRHCECIEDSYKSYSRRTFSFRGQLSDIQDDKVVTGVKVVLKENMFHIQIQQGKLMPEGLIDQSSIEWKPIEDIRYDREETLRQEKLIYYVRDNDGADYEMKESTEFGTLKGEQAEIYIDELFVPAAHVITGLRFNYPLDGGELKQNSIQLEIHASPVDLDNGKIEGTDDNSSVWVTPNDMIGQYREYRKERTELKWDKPINPLDEPGELSPVSSPNSYVRVDTGVSQFDGEEIVLPFFDGQEIAGEPAFASEGIGWYLASTRKGGGGFMTFRFYPIDLIRNMPINKLYESDKLDSLEEFGGCNTNLPN